MSVSLFTALDVLPDHRSRLGRRYALKSLILLILCGLMSGRKSLAAIARYGRDLTVEQRRQLGFRRDGPCHATLCVQLQGLDAEALQKLLGGVALSGCTDSTKHLAIDGKRLRGSRRSDASIHDGVHLLHVFSQELGGAIGQQPVASGGNEITAMLTLLDKLELEDTVITGDAIFAQREICRTIRNKQGHYLFPIKDNHKPVKQAIEQAMETVDKKTAAGANG